MNSIINTILVPIDFTEYSTRTLEAAVLIAKKNNSKLIALNILDFSTIIMSDIHINGGEDWSLSSLEERSLNLLHNLKSTIENEYQFKIEVLVKKGVVVSSIIKTAEEIKADLIIIGSHGTGDRAIFLGSHAYFIVMRSNYPVIAIPNGREDSAFTKLIFTDKITQSSTRNYELLKTIIHEKDIVLEVPGLIKNGSKININVLNETINYLGNNLLENKFQSSGKLKSLVYFINETLNDLKVELITIPNTSDNLNEPTDYSKIPILSITR